MRATLPHQPALDGIRGLLVPPILAFHAGMWWAGGAYLAVSTFFTLSAYLITSLLLVEHGSTGRISLARFWERRARRLMPAALMGIGLALLYGLWFADASQLAKLRADALSALFYVANWRFYLSGQGYEHLFEAPSPLLHYWSLAIEEQFYVVYPLLAGGVLVLSRGSRRALGAVVGLIALASVARAFSLEHAGADPSRIYYGTDARAAELAAGALLALVCRPGPAATPRAQTLLAGAGLVALFAAVAGFVLAPPFYVLGGWLPLFSLVSVGLLAGALQPGPAQRILSFAPLRGLGQISYGVYVVHWPVYLWLDEARTGLAPEPLLALRCVVVIGIALASYRWLETPVRRSALAGRRALASGLAGVATLACAVLLVTPLSSAPAPDAWYAGAAEASGAADARESPRHRSLDGPVVLVVGGSHAFSLWRGLSPVGKRAGFLTHRATQFGCGIARGGRQQIAMGRKDYGARCDAFTAQWREKAQTLSPDLVMLFPNVWDLTDRELPGWDGMQSPGDSEFDAWLLHEYEDATQHALRSGARATWVTVPCVGPGARLGPMEGNPALSDERIAYLNQEVLPRVVAENPGVGLIDLHTAICGDPPAVSIGLPEELRPDGLHYSKEGGKAAAAWILPHVLRAARAPEKGPVSAGL